MKRLDAESGGFTARIFREMLGLRPPPPWEEPEVRIQMGWTPSATAEPGSDRIGGTALSFNERSP